MFAAVFYTGLGLAAFWYVRKIAHPDRKLWVAWFQFIGLIAGTIVATLIVLVTVAMATGIGGSAIGRVAAPVVVIGVLIPTWRYAKAFIRKPPISKARGKEEKSIVGLGILLSFDAFAQDPAGEVEIISKEDAKAMFAMTEDQWLANIRQAVAAGVARAMGTPETGFGMAMNTAEGDILVVKPDYGENKRKPEFIQITVGYRDPSSRLSSKSALEEAIQVTNKQMKPEFDVIDDVQAVEGGISVIFFITESKSE